VIGSETGFRSSGAESFNIIIIITIIIIIIIVVVIADSILWVYCGSVQTNFSLQAINLRVAFKQQEKYSFISYTADHRIIGCRPPPRVCGSVCGGYGDGYEP
jgi:lipopolysaccharide export LptBFGC system permease protein LptF